MKKTNTVEERKGALKNLGKAILVWAIAMLVGWGLWSCKSIQTQTQISYRDSIIYHIVTDTVFVTITDTVHVEVSRENESESNTEIQFGEGGGTWNALTGEATNVTNVKQSTKEKELQQMILNYKHEADSASARRDSLVAANRDLQEQIEHQENTKEIKPRSGWDLFCTWWTIGSWILILLAVAWFVFKKFYLHR